MRAHQGEHHALQVLQECKQTVTDSLTWQNARSLQISMAAVGMVHNGSTGTSVLTCTK